MIYSTTRTTSQKEREILNCMVNGEHIREWAESSPWSNVPFPMYRIYAETIVNSQATNLLMKTKNFSEITREELDDAVGRTEALKKWEDYKFNGTIPSTPSVVVMAGYPLSGKSTLAKEMLKYCQDNTVIVESDMIRSYVAKLGGDDTPRYTVAESRSAFNICHELIRIGLSNKSNVIFDATNLQERDRYSAYIAAEEYAAPVAVVLVEAPDEILIKRADEAEPNRKKALKRMLDYDFTKVTGGRTFIKVNSSEEPYKMLQSIKGELPIKIKSDSEFMEMAG